MKNYLKVLLGTLVLALAGAVYATVTINGDNCGDLSGNVTISATGDVTINTSNTLCGYNRGSGGGEDPPPVATYNLTIAATNGSVARSAAGTGCGTGCYTYNDGQSVTLTASPSSGYTFAGWSGACTNTSGTCTVIMTTNRSVTANFTPAVASGDCPTPPAGSTIVNESFPAQLTAVEYSANTILSMPLPKTGGKLVAFKNNVSSSATRYLVISTCPGDVYSTGKSRSCYASGSEAATIWFSNGGSGCDISGNETYYVNVSHYSLGGRLGCTTRTCGYSVGP